MRWHALTKLNKEMNMETGMVSGFNGLIDMVQGPQANEINGMLQDLKNQTGDDLTRSLTMLNFKVGQYNAMIELTSGLSKSMTDTLRSVCQKV